MALYAFDGTWGENKPDDEKDTNVRKFFQAYGVPKEDPNKPDDRDWYREGVGTEFGLIGRVFGGAKGFGGHRRVKEGYARLEKNFRNGDKTIDIVGFSRGAALALHFANTIADQGVNGEKAPAIRFLGLWDTVASFGIPGNDINLGYKLYVPGNVKKCFHALALDERRFTFTPERLSATVDDAGEDGRLYEVWFRGVHSDIGGGNGNVSLSSITLHWMMRMAMRQGLPIAPDALERHQSARRPGNAIRRNKFDPRKDPYRPVRWNDLIHESVQYRADHNNPPNACQVVNDDGTTPLQGRFKRP